MLNLNSRIIHILTYINLILPCAFTEMSRQTFYYKKPGICPAFSLNMALVVGETECLFLCENSDECRSVSLKIDQGNTYCTLLDRFYPVRSGLENDCTLMGKHFLEICQMRQVILIPLLMIK